MTTAKSSLSWLLASLTVATLTLIGVEAEAQVQSAGQNHNVATLSIEDLQRSINSLSLTLKETQAIANACDLTVSRMEYLPDLALLNIEVTASNFCPADAIAPRSAHLTWELPSDRRNTQSMLALRVNDKVLGKVSIGNKTAHLVIPTK